MFYNEETSKKCLLMFLWSRYLWELYINIRQYEVCKKSDSVPFKLITIIQKEAFDKARFNMIGVNKSRFIENAYSILTSSTIISSGLLANVWSYAISVSPCSNEIALNCLWSFLLTALSALINFPASVYRTFVVQKRYDLNTVSITSFFINEVKSFFLSQCFALPVIIATICLVKYIGNWFYISLWILLSIFTFVSLIVYPIYLAPVRDNYKPLPSGELRTKIEELAQLLDYPLQHLYVVKENKKLPHKNTYVYGLTGPKHIVLSETLLGSSTNVGYKNDEILALLTHEFGHWIHNHLIKHVVLGQVYLISMLLTYKLMINCPLTYRAVGFAENVQPTLPGVVVVLEYILEPLNALLLLVYNYFSRIHEFEADAFVKQLGKLDSYESALLQLYKDNMEFPICDAWFSVWYNSRPTLLQRLDALNAE